MSLRGNSNKRKKNSIKKIFITQTKTYEHKSILELEARYKELYNKELGEIKQKYEDDYKKSIEQKDQKLATLGDDFARMVDIAHRNNEKNKQLESKIQLMRCEYEQELASERKLWDEQRKELENELCNMMNDEQESQNLLIGDETADILNKIEECEENIKRIQDIENETSNRTSSPILLPPPTPPSSPVPVLMYNDIKKEKPKKHAGARPLSELDNDRQGW